jgi:hypothetical protein
MSSLKRLATITMRSEEDGTTATPPEPETGEAFMTRNRRTPRTGGYTQHPHSRRQAKRNP